MKSRTFLSFWHPLQWKNAVITIDAMGMQREMANLIIEQKRGVGVRSTILHLFPSATRQDLCEVCAWPLGNRKYALDIGCPFSGRRESDTRPVIGR